MLVRGRYYFSPAGTPYYPGSHLLGSRTWDDTNHRTEYPLGEVRGLPDTWDSGKLPEVVPDALIAGSVDCIANGEPAAHALPFDRTIAGYPAACFVRPAMPDATERLLFNIFRCDVQGFYCRVISHAYEDDVAAINQEFSLFTNGRIAPLVHPATRFLPTVITVVTPLYSVMICDGSRSDEQVALQAFYSLTGPQNYGAFGTNPFWYAASLYALGLLVGDGADPAKPMLFVGHSYGAATAAISAARALEQSPIGKRSLLTFGMPKPGDQRLIDKLAGLRCAHVATDADWITIVPFGDDLLFQLTPVLGAGILLLWGGWQTPSGKFVFDEDGNVTRGQAYEPDYNVILAAVTQAIAHENIDPIAPHTIEEYARRIALRCFARVPVAFGELLLSNRPAIAAGRLMLKAPAIAAGRLMFDEFWKVLPSEDCEHANYLPAGKCSGPNTYGQVEQWFKFKVTEGVPYSVTIAHGSVTPHDVSLFSGTNCGDLALLYQHVPAVNFSFDALGTGDYWLQLGYDATQETTYTLCLNDDSAEDTPMVGEIRMWSATTAPAGWITCAGQEVSRTTYAELFALIGTTYGAGDGSTTFNLPDLQGRAPIGYGTGSGLSARTIGTKGGNETHALSTAELASHTHNITGEQQNSMGFNSGTKSISARTVPTPSFSTSYASDSAGSGTAHNNMQPFSVVSFIIKV